MTAEFKQNLDHLQGVVTLFQQYYDRVLNRTATVADTVVIQEHVPDLGLVQRQLESILKIKSSGCDKHLDLLYSMAYETNYDITDSFVKDLIMCGWKIKETDAIFNAIEHNNLDVVKVLLENNADPNRVDGHTTALEYVLSEFYDVMDYTKPESVDKVEGIVRLLLQYGAKPEITAVLANNLIKKVDDVSPSLGELVRSLKVVG